MRLLLKYLSMFMMTSFLLMVFFTVHNIINSNRKTPHQLKRIFSRKRESYRQRKAKLYQRVHQYILYENMSLVNSKARKKKRPIKSPQTQWSDDRLSRMLYQVWDPNIEEQTEDHLLSCEHLASPDQSLYRKGKRFARKLNRKFYEYANISDIWEMIRYNCNGLRTLFRFQTPKFGPASYSIAYTVTLDRTAEQSIRMLLSIYHHDNVYCVHPNAKYGFKYYNIFRRITECIPNIVLPDRIFEIRLKTHNRLKAELSCFKKLLNISVPWRYGINLPSSSFPLHNNSKLVKYLKARQYEVSISWEKPVEDRFLSRVRYRYLIKEDENGERVLLRTTALKSSPPHNIEFFRKGNHFISTRDFYRFLTNSSISQDFLNWTRDAKNPEDFYYSSLYKHHYTLVHSLDDPPDYTVQQQVKLDSEIEDVSITQASELMTSLWISDRSHRCHGKYRGSVCIFSAADLRWLLQQDELFANSFDFRIDRVIIDCLTKNLKHPILKADSYY